MSREFKVRIKVVREHFATVTVRARSQAEADRAALAYDQTVLANDEIYCCDLGLGAPWHEDSRELEPEIDRTFRCIDCGKDTMDGEYYVVTDEVWAASGLAPDGGMLCLADLERRIGRWLTLDDFKDCLIGIPQDWERHAAARSNSGCPLPDPAQPVALARGLLFADQGRVEQGAARKRQSQQ